MQVRKDSLSLTLSHTHFLSLSLTHSLTHSHTYAHSFSPIRRILSSAPVSLAGPAQALVHIERARRPDGPPAADGLRARRRIAAAASAADGDYGAGLGTLISSGACERDEKASGARWRRV